MSEYHEQVIGKLYLDRKALKEEVEKLENDYRKRSEDWVAVRDQLQNLKGKYTELYRKYDNAQQTIELMGEEIRSASKGEQQRGNSQADGVE